MRIERIARNLGSLVVLFLSGGLQADGAESPYRLQVPLEAYRVTTQPAWRLPAPVAHNPATDRRPYAEVIARAADAAGIETELLHAVVKVESAYDADALSSKGARGLAQVLPATAARFGPRGATGTHANLHAGARFLRSLLDRFDGDMALALAAYNAGPGAVERHGGIPPYPETQAYVPRVLAEYDTLRAARKTRPAPWQLGEQWHPPAAQPDS